MKKFLNAVNNPKSDTIYPMCLMAAILCSVQVITHAARLVIMVNLLFSAKPVQTVSYMDVLSEKPAMPPSAVGIIIQLLLAVIPACLCVLSFRGINRPVQKKSLLCSGICMAVTAVISLSAISAAALAGAGWVVLTVIAACALAASAVLLIAGKGSNALIIGLAVVFVIAAMLAKAFMPIEPLYAMAVALGGSAVLLASQDPKMA